MNARSLIAALFTIAVWSSLALLADRVSHLPPLLSTGLALMVGGLIGAWQPAAWRAPLRGYALAAGGLFGYHALLFAAFALAPAVEANLLQYLWPLLIVVLSPLFFPAIRLTGLQLAGALLGFAGAVLIFAGSGLALSTQYLSGYLCAVAAALVWAVYSLGCRRLQAFPTSAVAASCLIAGVMAVALQLALQGPTALLGLQRSDLLLLLALGLGPMGLSFLTWDFALKHGDPRAVAALAYLTPLLSIGWLTLLNGHGLTTRSALAMLAILAGAVLGNLEIGRAAARRGSPQPG